jgi:hypothetical protein
VSPGTASVYDAGTIHVAGGNRLSEGSPSFGLLIGKGDKGSKKENS